MSFHKRIGLTLMVLIIGSMGFYLMKPIELNLNGNSDLIEKDGLLFYKGKVFTGIINERFPNQTVYRKTSYRDGFKDGYSEEYGTTGALRARWQYKQNIKDGLQQGWYIEGPQKFKQYYKNGLLHGQSSEWYLNGNLFRNRLFEKGTEVASKILFSTNEVHTNYVKRDGSIYGLKTGELCMDYETEGLVSSTK